MKKKLLTILLLASVATSAQPVLETGSQKPMPESWIDASTNHTIVRLSNKPGRNSSFYFHNSPFVGNKMVFYSTDSASGRQLYTVDLTTKKIEQLTHQGSPMNGEIVSAKGHNVYYQIKDSVFVTNIDTKQTQLVFVFPDNFKASITTVNANETLLAGARSTDAEKEIFKQNPAKHDYFQKIYEARLPRTLFVIDLNSKQLKPLFTDSAWLNHVQFSSTDPNLLMFCHEGPWHKVNRIWTIDVRNPAKDNARLMHKRTMDMEIAGHEWFAPDGNTIWFDLQQPRGSTFYVAGVNVKTLEEKKYQLQRNEWSIHYTNTPDQKLFAGDGGDPRQVAKAPDGRWIYLFKPEGDHFKAEKLVNMRHHDYKLEPNVHFSPDKKWVIFRANFEGVEQVYAVKLTS
ncbi:oligogalacturonate lyase family protein [Niastella sp. OAS944]|uniref:oligogalacturonate lyase family protein n=1 Tax=Niastella sp. OAS944 TaxID=2664089 RepID=UPI00346CA2BA|nr:oligogalacturonide lyase [Chitinophagaceae bacterium OAS944]